MGVLMHSVLEVVSSLNDSHVTVVASDHFVLHIASKPAYWRRDPSCNILHLSMYRRWG